ncbi:hypothetical protein C4J89_1018 [Pseudomonas sp. R4-35-07]|nr:hypothetical protein C4J91_1091 [Pseudomonas sp. R3-52-08]AZF30509.1 hypothetical protein C4J89_1018 [Pseudomonas sp. R4-35-07]
MARHSNALPVDGGFFVVVVSAFNHSKGYLFPADNAQQD